MNDCLQVSINKSSQDNDNVLSEFSIKVEFDCNARKGLDNDGRWETDKVCEVYTNTLATYTNECRNLYSAGLDMFQLFIFLLGPTSVHALEEIVNTHYTQVLYHIKDKVRKFFNSKKDFQWCCKQHCLCYICHLHSFQAINLRDRIFSYLLWSYTYTKLITTSNCYIGKWV